MKSVFNKIDKEKSKEIVFPVLAEVLVQDESFVVLFLSKNTGVVVKGNLDKDVGDLRSNFVSITDESFWRILSPEESIVLSNNWYFSCQIFFDPILRSALVSHTSVLSKLMIH